MLFLSACATTAPLPSSINIYKPRPNVPPELAAFSGIWSGRWHGSLDAILVVYYIDIYKAQIILSTGKFANYLITPQDKYIIVTAEVDRPTHSIKYVPVNGYSFSFVMNDTLDEITGYFIEEGNGVIQKANMNKMKADEIPNVNITYRILQ